MTTATPLEERIRLARPALDARENKAIAAVLESGMLVSGAHVERFEDMVRARCGRAHAIAVGSGTAALILAMRALDLGASEVLVPALTWPSPAHAITVLGGRARLADVDLTSWNGGAASFDAARTRETRGIVAIDQFGVPADHEAIAKLGLPVIEDAACAIGSTRHGRAAGSFGLISTLSFHPRKVITTGEGGMCLTDDAELAKRLRAMRNHGQSTPGTFMLASSNERITEMQAAMGIVQMEKLDEILARRRAIAAHYRSALAHTGLIFQSHEGAETNEQTMGALVPSAWSSSERDKLLAYTFEQGVECGKLSYDLSTLESLPGPHSAVPHTKTIVARGFALPLHTLMSDADVERVIATLRSGLQRIGESA